VAELVDARDL